MSNIDSLIEKYTTVEELRIFCQAQMKQIQTLTRKNKELQEKIDNASKLPTISGESLAPNNLDISKEDAKLISEIQLFMLKKIAMERELNMDEAKRVELYNRILKEINNKDKDNSAGVDKAPTAELLKLVE